MDIRQIGIIGVGGVGGYFGGKLCALQNEDSGIEVSFIARGAHLEAIRTSGLLLSSEKEAEIACRPARAMDDFRKLPSLDLCLLCVKEFDLPVVLSALQHVIVDQTVIMPLLNGVDVYARVRKSMTHGIVLPACVYVGTHIERPGHVVQKGGAARILFGADPLRTDFDPRKLLAAFAQANIKSDWVSNIQAEIWQKFIFICAYGLVSAAHARTMGEILEDDALRDAVETIMAEVVSLAERSGVALPEGIIEISVQKARTFPHGAKTSFQRDYERADRKDERDLFAGTMIRMADEFNVPIPRTRELAAILSKGKPVRW